MKYIKIQKYNYSYNYLHIYSIFVLRPEFQVARMQIKVITIMKRELRFTHSFWVESGPYLQS